jgi:anthranilate/para-aminobenzoate synthase component I
MCKIHYAYSFSRVTVLSPFCWDSQTYLFGSNSSPTLSPGFVKLGTRHFGAPLNKSTMTSDEYKNAVMKAKEHIMAGDIFQIVLSQRFERRTYANPFEVYRALRIVNPSPYMAYVQVATETLLICFLIK